MLWYYDKILEEVSHFFVFILSILEDLYWNTVYLDQVWN